MRTYNYSGTSISCEYPDQLTWLGDNNTITIRSGITTDHIGARVTVMEPAGNTQVLDYWSETNYLVFVLNDTLRYLFNSNLSQWSVLVEAYNGVSQLPVFAFNMNVYNGKSFPDRSHAAARTIYWTDVNQLKKLQLFTYEGGTAYVNHSAISLNAGITSVNLYGWHLDEDEDIEIHTTTLLPSTPSVIGDMWHYTKTDNDIYHIRLKYINICDDNFNACRIHYTDTDGCDRWIGGKITKETDNSQGDMYTRITDVYRNIARKYNTKYSKVISVAFSDIDDLAYLQDILYSDTIEMLNYNGDLFPVAIETKKLETKDVTNDFTIDFIIINEN